MVTRQVYGVIFTTDGRVLLKVDAGDKCKYSLAGGTPESFDRDRVATLRRELIEEVNTTIFDPILIGYQEVIGDRDLPPYAQVRMVAMIDTIGPKQPDPDNGKVYDRLLVSPKRAIELMNWGEIGKTLINEGYRIAKENFVFTDIVDTEEYV